MSNFLEDKPDSLAHWRQQFGILITIATVACIVVSAFSLVFGPPVGAP